VPFRRCEAFDPWVMPAHAHQRRSVRKSEE
jgi:hypothetical protein